MAINYVAFKNAEGIQIAVIPILVAGKPYQLPDMDVPAGMAVIIRASFNNAGVIYVAPSAAECRDLTKSWPLQRNEFIGFFVVNTSVIWVQGTAVGVPPDLVLVCSERNVRA